MMNIKTANSDVPDYKLTSTVSGIIANIIT